LDATHLASAERSSEELLRCLYSVSSRAFPLRLLSTTKIVADSAGFLFYLKKGRKNINIHSGWMNFILG